MKTHKADTAMRAGSMKHGRAEVLPQVRDYLATSGRSLEAASPHPETAQATRHARNRGVHSPLNAATP
jgi:hypothetical protein